MSKKETWKRQDHKLFCAQKSRCGVCFEILGPRKDGGEIRWNLDHVWPKRYRRGNWGNIVLAHTRCNGKKADRRPTGCQILFLTIVNARMGL